VITNAAAETRNISRKDAKAAKVGKYSNGLNEEWFDGLTTSGKSDRQS